MQPVIGDPFCENDTEPPSAGPTWPEEIVAASIVAEPANGVVVSAVVVADVHVSPDCSQAGRY